MKKQEKPRNAFLALCDLASKENWCWKIPCTTCGSRHFRMSFLELINGKHPDDAGWSINTANHHHIKTGIPRGYSVEQQKALAEIVSKAKLCEIAKQVKLSDWLGCLGLVLLFCEENEIASRTLTKSLIPQFLGLIPHRDSSPEFFTRTVNGKRMLSWKDMASIERTLRSEGGKHYLNKRVTKMGKDKS